MAVKKPIIIFGCLLTFLVIISVSSYIYFNIEENNQEISYAQNFSNISFKPANITNHYSFFISETQGFLIKVWSTNTSNSTRLMMPPYHVEINYEYCNPIKCEHLDVGVCYICHDPTKSKGGKK